MGRMAGLRTRVLKNAFGNNFTDWKLSGFTNAAELKEATEIALEDFILGKNKIFLKKLQDAIFKLGKKMGNDTYLSFLRTLLFCPIITGAMARTARTTPSM